MEMQMHWPASSGLQPGLEQLRSLDLSRDDPNGTLFPDDIEGEEPSARFCVNWSGMLEPLEMPVSATIMDVSRFIDSAPEAPFQHKFFVFKGMLLHPSTTLLDANIKDGSVLHLILNDDPYRGRPLYVRCREAATRLVLCGADYYVEDVKEELSCFQGEDAPEDQRLVFAGRELQDQHTLREYNIQKPSVLLSLGPPHNGRRLETFVESFLPPRDATDVPLSSTVTIRFHRVETTDQTFWGQMLGPPDLPAIKSHHVVVSATHTKDHDVEGDVAVDERNRTVTWTPKRPLQAASRYTVTVNGGKERDGEAAYMRHSRAKETVVGTLKWDFFTRGYQPLRITAIYPRPHSRIRAGFGVVMLSFSGDIDLSANLHEWVSVRGHELAPPLYDPSTRSLLYRIASHCLPNEICRVRIRVNLVRGVGGESLLPRQQDGMLKTTTFRWKFYTGELSQYEESNLASSGLMGVLKRYQAGALQQVGGGGGGGQDGGMSMGGAGDAQGGLGWLNPGNLLGLGAEQGPGGGGNWLDGRESEQGQGRGGRGGDGGGGGQGGRHEWQF